MNTKTVLHTLYLILLLAIIAGGVIVWVAALKECMADYTLLTCLTMLG